jgi:Fic family protein/DNA-binding XRE family transcriptional regulator
MNYATQLKQIQKASLLSQESLARELDVSFVTLNSWINGRSQPRQKALQKIEELYLNIIGADQIDEDNLKKKKLLVNSSKLRAKDIIQDVELLNRLTLYLTYHTNTIEGSTMTISDVKDVLFQHKSLTNRTALEQVEARNHQTVLLWILQKIAANNDLIKINNALIRDIHLRLMNGIISDAGEYRRHTVRILGTRVALANHLKIEKLINDFAKNLGNPTKDVVSDLAKTHAIFEKIHPFSDGNGRVGRLLMLIQALQAGITPPLVQKERKIAYYKYLELAQTKNSYKPLELFIAESIEFANKILS